MANEKKLKLPKPSGLGGGLLMAGLTIPGVVMDINEGQGVVKSIAKAGVEFAISDLVMGAMGMGPSMALMGIQLGGAAIDAGLSAGRDKAYKTANNLNGFGVVGGNFGVHNDNKYSATMRQRSMKAMGLNSGMSRNALGNEARKRASSISY